ncbi:hypothetical protein KQI42_20300 [Tissierella sp. MSJ-40]|uniref:Uncharacterized protein n=1 Tax=Tissierella simiarum TaxID=2841534 RepID=A0ABS6EBN4_9FIRM|nr:hypothetical protein [Tissierella simiarum]MBU5440341.1 hypothetical protein [Tissierella simiarum]
MYRGIENTIKVIVDGFKKFIKGTDESDKKDDFIIGEKSKYYRINGVHVIETAPKNVYI